MAPGRLSQANIKRNRAPMLTLTHWPSLCGAPDVMAHRSPLPRWLRMGACPICLWMITGLTYTRPDAPDALALMRAAVLPVAVLATAYMVLIVGILNWREVRHAK